MAAEEQLPEVEFKPLLGASRRRMIARGLLTPLVWLIALVTVAIVRRHTSAIAVALAITAGCIVVSYVILSLVRSGRERDRRRYAQPG